MPGRAKVSGSWKDVSAVRVKVSGAWKEVSKGYTKVSGAWKEWYSSAAPSSYELIETVNISGTSTTSVTFSNLNNYNTTYQHLQIRAVMKTSAGTGFNTTFKMRMNGDSGNNYANHTLYETDGSVKSDSETSQNGINLWALNPNGVSAGYQAFVMDILDPYESKNKTIRSLDGGIQTTTNYQKFIQLRSGVWMNTGQLQSINFSLSVDAFGDLSRFSIYGIKGS